MYLVIVLAHAIICRMTSVTFARRSLQRAPGLVTAIVLSLAIGIGANTALFRIVYRLVYQQSPVRHPEQLVHLRRVVEIPNGTEKPTRLDPADITADGSVFSDVTGFAKMETAIGINAQVVRRGFFDVLGVRMRLGSPGRAERGVVISHRLWQSRFGAKSDVLNTSFTIEGRSYDIAGVAPTGFFGLDIDSEADAWIWPDPSPASRSYEVIARLRPGIGPANAELAMTGVFRNLEPHSNRAARIDMAGSGLSLARRDYRGLLTALLGLAFLVLLATCANIATLLAIRNAARTRDFAMLSAIGAQRGDLLKQLFIEGAAMAGSGALLAIPIATVVSRLMLSVLPVSWKLEFDLYTASILCCLGVVTTIAFTIGPALHATTTSRIAAGLQARKSATLPRTTMRLQAMLAAAQICLAVVVLTGTLLFVQTIRNLLGANIGYQTSSVVQILVNPQSAGYEPKQMGAVYRRISAALAEIPGVESVTGVRNQILRGTISLWKEIDQLEVGPEFFETMKIPLVRGRYFNQEDHSAAGFKTIHTPDGIAVRLPQRVVVSQSLARKLYGDSDPIGQRLEEPFYSKPVIVGVVKDGRFSTVRDPRPLVYMSFGPEPDRFNALLLRISKNRPETLSEIQRKIRQENPSLFTAMRTLEEEIDSGLQRERLAAITSGILGALALLLVVSGVFAVTAYAAAMRKREFGIRIVLGAKRLHVLKESVSGIVPACAAGMVTGIAISVAVLRVSGKELKPLLYGISPENPATLTFVTGALLVLVAAACSLPAWRAMRTDPNIVRYDT